MGQNVHEQPPRLGLLQQFRVGGLFLFVQLFYPVFGNLAFGNVHPVAQPVLGRAVPVDRSQAHDGPQFPAVFAYEAVFQPVSGIPGPMLEVCFILLDVLLGPPRVGQVQPVYFFRGVSRQFLEGRIDVPYRGVHVADDDRVGGADEDVMAEQLRFRPGPLLGLRVQGETVIDQQHQVVGQYQEEHLEQHHHQRVRHV